MCGLVVCHLAERPVGADPSLPAHVDRTRAALERVTHRGPDGAGHQVAGRTILGHRRLSIVDVAGGGQPMLNEDGTLALVCNGEIYNHATLRADLERRHIFRTRSDSEVILHLYEEQGMDCVRLLDGMFAFVLSDGDRLLAARDPLGIKPLYMGHDGDDHLWFASEIKALAGLCADIDALPPGHVFASGQGLRRWFTPAWTQPPPVRASPLKEDARVAAQLTRAVEKRLMSDVPLGVFLSGGLDSSLVAALMRPHVDDLHSFAVGLEGAPDLLAAREVSRHLGTRHHEHVYTPADAMAALDTVVAHLESYDPALIRSAVPCFFVSRLAANHVKVVLTGEGADEAFAGYRYFRDVDDAGDLHHESVRLLSGLHHINLQRLDRMTMAHGLEGRVPFLDVAFLDHAMSLDPRLKLQGAGRPEKWHLRASFDGLLPRRILWRTKQEFARGCGSEWTMREACEALVSDAELEHARRRFPIDSPATKEAYHYRRLFDDLFPGEAARRTVGRWRGSLAPSQENSIHA